ncbi:hypothetical protein F5Y14DRAFT_453975 [Nemania sp. NC0429]|nr:hypothetical protein F5Y14DRAFT_453975 [Nemania sp. NC0429]
MLKIGESLFLIFVCTISVLPMPTVLELVPLLLFASAPLMARATSEGAPQIVTDAVTIFMGVTVVLAIVISVRTVNEILGLTALPRKFFALLVSL